MVGHRCLLNFSSNGLRPSVGCRLERRNVPSDQVVIVFTASNIATTYTTITYAATSSSHVAVLVCRRQRTVRLSHRWTVYCKLDMGRVAGLSTS